MKYPFATNNRYCLILFTLLFFSVFYAMGQEGQTESTIYRLEAVGTAAAGEKTPFWMVSNQYGVVPLDAGNGVLRAGVFHNQTLGNEFRWTAGVELIGATPRYKHVYLQQFYAEIGYKALLLSVGSKERYTSFVDKRLSSGDLVYSNNARPIPEVNLSIPEYTLVPYTKGWLWVKGDFAVGKSFDTAYLTDYVFAAQTPPTYVNDVLWHHKSGYVQIKDREERFPLYVTIGLDHWVQWGGTSTNPKIGKQPQSFKDFLRVVAGSEGGEGATISDMVNALGNHYGAYFLGIGYKLPRVGQLQLYHQRYFNDKAGMVFTNGSDGLWGVELATSQFPWMKKIVIEYLTTKNQSGPIHYIDFDRENHPGRGGGRGNYYNNEEYTTGSSYFNRGLGSPILLSPEYNGNGKIGFLNNRVASWHLGVEGAITSALGYRMILTSMKGWGCHYIPLIDVVSSVSTLFEIVYKHPRLSGWEFGGALAFDTGDMDEKNSGFSLRIRKTGLLKNW